MTFGLILLGSFLLLVLLNVPIAVSLGVASLIGLWYTGTSLDMLAPLVYSSIGKFTLLSIPFFIFAGLIMEKVGISRRLIYFVETLVGSVRGGLSLTAVIVACFFAAISGSGPATVAAIGVILIPALIAQGYDRGMSAALLSAAGSIGIIIPPSVAFIIYASIVQVSISDMFLAGIIPGLVIALFFIGANYYLIRNNKTLAETRKYSAREKWNAFKDAFWGLMAPVIILGGIYGGIFTPTEAAGVACVYGLAVGLFVYKELDFKRLFTLLVDSAVSTAVVMFIVASATLFAWLLTTSLAAQEMSAGLLGLTTNEVMLLILINIIFLIAGFFIDTISAYFILLPVVIPIATQIGLDPIHLGVFLTVNLAIGQFTPPVGVNLFVASNVGKVPLQEVIRGSVAYIIAGILALIVITYIPALSTWLPSILK